MTDEFVTVASGTLRGRVSDGVAGFRGIRYGEAVSGARRWQRASPVKPWAGVRDALDLGPRAIQPESSDMKVASAEFEALMAQGGPAHDEWKTQSEECLTLSVWTPDMVERRPVMFWCHGGKYFGETPPAWWFDGENLARTGDVVVVTARHRVGVLGFLHLADLPGGAGYADAANIGMLDLVDALAWVRDNIGRFGGDPDNVTIFGESGGGLKVSVLLGMPAAKGLFHKAIVQSGAQLEARSREQGTDAARALLADLGLASDEVGKLFEVPAERLVEAQIRLMPDLWAPSQAGPAAEFEPIVDGGTVPGDCFDPAASPISRDVPLLVGTCATETTFFLSAMPGVFDLPRPQMEGMVRGMFGADGERLLETYRANRPDQSPSAILFAITSDFIFRSKAIRMAERKVAQGSAAVYMYVLAFATDVHGGKFRTPHILDLPLVFAHPDHPILGSDPARFAVSQQMSGAWAAFAHTGCPAMALLPPWPAYDLTSRSTMYFAATPRLELDPRPDERQAW